MADPAALGAELDMLMRRAGLAIPPDRRAQVLTAYAELRDQIELLRGRPATAEPSNIFRLHRMTPR